MIVGSSLRDLDAVSGFRDKDAVIERVGKDVDIKDAFREVSSLGVWVEGETPVVPLREPWRFVAGTDDPPCLHPSLAFAAAHAQAQGAEPSYPLRVGVVA